MPAHGCLTYPHGHERVPRRVIEKGVDLICAQRRDHKLGGLLQRLRDRGGLERQQPLQQRDIAVLRASPVVGVVGPLC